MKVAVVPPRSVVKQGFIENDFGVAAIGKAANEIGPADILAINIEAEAGRKQHAKRRQYAQDAGLLVGGLQHHHRQADLGRSSAMTFCIRAHCSPGAPAGVSQTIDQAPCEDLTLPACWAFA
jgi:hypothetical protein